MRSLFVLLVLSLLCNQTPDFTVTRFNYPLMKITASIAGLVLASVPLSAADADLKASISAAATRLTDQSGYRWQSTTRSEGGGPFGGTATTTGQTEKDGYLWVTLTSAPVTTEFARKADQAAVVLDGNCMTLEQAAS